MSIGSLLKVGGSIVGGLLSKRSGNKQAENIRAGSREAAAKFADFSDVGGAANRAIAGALGVSGAPEQSTQFQNFLNSTGFKARLQAGSEAITGNRAAAGLLNTGATLKRLTTFGQDLAQGGFSNFLSQLGGVAGRGLSAAGGEASALVGANIPAASAIQRGEAGFQSGLGSAFEDASQFFSGNTRSPGGAVVGGVEPLGPRP